MPFDFAEQLETLVLETGPADIPNIPEPPTEASAAPEIDTSPPELDLMDGGDFHAGFVMVHRMLGGMVSARTGEPCPLGDQADNEGGREASKAMYELIKSSPFLANLILSTKSTFLGQLAAIGMHGFACVQIVKASSMAAQNVEEAEVIHD